MVVMHVSGHGIRSMVGDLRIEPDVERPHQVRIRRAVRQLGSSLHLLVVDGNLSATTNVVTVDVQQPYPALAPDVEELTARVEALESQLASVGSSVGVPEPVVFSCVPSAWEATVGSGSTTTVCSVDVTLPTRSIVYAQVDGHWHTSDTSHWCIAEINFPGEAPYPNGSSPYAQRWAPHHYLAGWTPINYSRARVLDAGTHTLSYTISAAPGGACYLNGSGLHGLTIGVSSTPSE